MAPIAIYLCWKQNNWGNFASNQLEGHNDKKCTHNKKTVFMTIIANQFLVYLDIYMAILLYKSHLLLPKYIDKLVNCT